MKSMLKRHAAQAVKAKPLQPAHTAPIAAPAVRSWSAPDPGAFAAQKPVAASVAKPEALDRSMVATLAKIAGKS